MIEVGKLVVEGATTASDDVETLVGVGGADHTDHVLECHDQDIEYYPPVPV